MLTPTLAACARAHGGVFSSVDALAAGYSYNEIRRLVRAGSWVRLRRGVFMTCADWKAIADEPRARHVAHCHAVVMGAGANARISHESAAVLHGVALLRPPDSVTHLTVPHATHRAASDVCLHYGQVPQHHDAMVGGIRATNLDRTLFDLSRRASLEAAVVSVDDALHRGLVTVESLRAVIDECQRWPGHARAFRALQHANGMSESPGETLSRLVIWGSDLPRPELQVTLVLNGLAYRVDFYWPDLRVVGEFDGRLKYQTRSDLVNEKLREDRLREHGYGFARWGWAETVGEPAVVVERIRRALQVAARTQTGTLAVAPVRPEVA